MFDESEVIRVKPIVEHHRAEVDIIWCVRGPMDDHRTKDAPGVLSTIVGVVPGGDVEISIVVLQERHRTKEWFSARYHASGLKCLLQGR